MAEEDINYASVVFYKKKSFSPKDEKEAETVYDEVKVENEAANQNGGTIVSTGSLPDKKGNKGSCQCQQSSCCLGILCVFLLLSVVAAVVYGTAHCTSEQNQESLLAANLNLTDLNNKLSSENEKLRRDNDNLTQSLAVLENKIANLTVENQELKGRNQELEKQSNNLTEKIENLEANWNDLNVSRAQWSIDAYCPSKRRNRECKPCQAGWRHSQSSCYAINDASPGQQRSWDAAREDCKGKISDLVVIASQEEKKYVSDISWKGNGIEGYWIGLRVQDKKWQWINGSDLTGSSWIEQPPTDGHCAISVSKKGLKSVNCSDKNAWICEKKSLSV